MIKADALKQAIQLLYDAALLGDGWPDALEAMSRAAGSRGAVLMHNRHRKLVAAVTNEDIREPVEAFLAGKTPPNSRQTRVSHALQDGFRIDYDDYAAADIAYDPFYQDYLRPIGLCWHANARLKMEGPDEIAVSFKRELKHGTYEESDKIILDQILPHLRTASRVAECVFDAETRGSVKALHRRDRPVIEFDAWGRVRRYHGCFDGSDGPLVVRRSRVITVLPEDQARLETAIQIAVKPPCRQVSIFLHDAAGSRFIFQIVPSFGRARDVFIATSALGVLIGRPKRIALDIDQNLAIDLFKLTRQEARVAILVCNAHSTTEMASVLAVTADTVRFHLKSIFEKTAVRNRSELVSLFAMLSSP